MAAGDDPTSSAAGLASEICNQIKSVFTKPTTTGKPALDVMVEEISGTARRGGRIFVYGVGREGLMLKALCMRLFHMGLSAHCVFDMNTPPISHLDLLIASAGPGFFSTVDAICGVAKSNEAKVLLLTAQPTAGYGIKHASVVAHIPAQTMADDDEEAGCSISATNLLPMGSVYEGAMFVLFEMVVFRLSEVIGERSEAVRARHTNLE